jgi:hypothetical protein
MMEGVNSTMMYIRTCVNVIMYPQYNNNKKYFKKMFRKQIRIVITPGVVLRSKGHIYMSFIYIYR